MVGRTEPRVTLLLAFLAGAACGGKEPSDDDSSAGSASSGTAGQGTGGTASGHGGSGAGGAAGSVAGSAPGGSSAGGTAAGGGTPGGGTTGHAGAGGSSAAGESASSDCSGAFGEPTLVLTAPPGVTPQSLSVTGDDLELFYEFPNDGQHVMVQARTSRDAPFAEAKEVPPAVFDFCPPTDGPSIDVSDDGLRLYLTCVDTTADVIPPGPIYVADRPNRNTLAFVRRPDPLGTGGVSISVSADELAAFWSDYGNRDAPAVVTATRDSLTAAFGAPAAPSGLSNIELRHPELSTDALHLFGALADGDSSHLVMYTRAARGGAFGTPSTEGFPITPTIGSDPAVELIEDLTPTLSADCRSLYFLRHSVRTDGNQSAIYQARR